MADKIISPNDKVGILDFFIKHSKKAIIMLVAISLVASTALIAAWWYTGGSEVIAVYGGKKILRTEYEDAKIKCNGFYKYNSDKENEKKCSQTEIEDQIFRKALETEAEARGITVTESEINERYKQLISAYASEKSYEMTIKNAYGWTPEYVKANLKRDILQEKLDPYLINSRDVYGVFVRYDWFTGEPNLEQRKANETVSMDIMKNNLYPLIKNGSSKEVLTAEMLRLRATGSPWDRESNIIGVPYNNLNEKSGKKDFAGKEDWEAISKLNKVGDITGIVRSSAGYFVVYKLENISKGSFNDWDEFKKDAASKARIKSISYKYNQIKKNAAEKADIAINGVKKILHIEVANANLGHCGYSNFSEFWAYVRDGSNHALPIKNVSVVATNNAPTRTDLMCDQEDLSHSMINGTDGGFTIGKMGTWDARYGAYSSEPYALSCNHGWFIDLTRNGYEPLKYNRSTAVNGTRIPLDRSLNAVSPVNWEYYSGSEGSYRTWNTDGNGFVMMKPIETLGNFEGASCTSISGWAIDMTDENYQSQIHLYQTSKNQEWCAVPGGARESDPTCSGGYLLPSPVANLSRPDVASAYGITNGNHGFSFDVGNNLTDSNGHTIKDGQDHWIWTYAFSKSGGAYRLGPPRKINCPGTSVANSCPTSCTASPGTVTQGNPVTITWSGGVGTVTSLIQNPGSTIPNPTSPMQVMPSTNTSYSLTVEGVTGTCPCNPVPVIVKPSQSGGDSPVPPN